MDNVFALRKEEIAKDTRRKTRAMFLQNARDISNDPDFDGYAMVVWDKEGVESVAWFNGDKKIIPDGLIPEYTKTCLLTSLSALRNAEVSISQVEKLV